ncbi:MAG: lytic murein transglycosylase B [Sideroxydans sp.]|nr:lytic murein transglycosylase B [Sideroxydans sp.]
MIIARFFVGLLSLLLLSGAAAAELPGIPEFVDEMVAKHHFKRAELERLFQRAQYKQSIIDAITTPATTKPWPEYRAIFVNDRRIQAGLKFWKHHARTLRRAEKKYGVPQEIIVALIGVETLYGEQTGSYRTVDALATLAFRYPPRAPFFRGELEQYLLLARDQDFNLLAVQGSYAGALGIPQFMPSSYRKYAVDFDLDGKIDLLHDPIDAIGSVANYLKQFGWNKGEPVAVRGKLGEGVSVDGQDKARSISEWAAAGVTSEQKLAPEQPAYLLDFTVADGKEFWLVFNNFRVITRYNNSNFYAMSVFQLAEALRAARHPVIAG